MNLNNGKISERQCFRIGLWENIAIPMVALPFVTVRVAGRYHVLAFLVGVIMFVGYAMLLYFFARKIPEGMVTAVFREFGWWSKLIAGIYVVRYVLRASLILLYFSMAAHTYMLRGIALYALAIPFALICGYGALRDIEKRGRLLELLFWWMITPLILIAVFAVGNAEWTTLDTELFGFSRSAISAADMESIILAAYFMLIATSGIELMMHTIVAQKTQSTVGAWKLLVWVLISFLLSYLFVIGILGAGWVRRDSLASLNVMEAAAVPGGVIERMDYAVLAFWVIGVFAIMSGYLHYAKKYAWSIVSSFVSPKKRDTAERSYIECFVMLGLVILVVFMMWLWQRRMPAQAMAWYLIRFDLLISLAIPFVTIWIKKRRETKKLVMLVLLLVTSGITLIGCGKKYESASLENRDYVRTMIVGGAEKGHFEFCFEIADLSEYEGDGAKSLGTSDYKCDAAGIEDALQIYYEDKKRQLDLGHLRKMEFEDTLEEAQFELLIRELADMPFVPKSVPVSDSVVLRDLIKELFSLKE
ncbi:MAG: GerAB/ArcD/ProY family transporter [Eubacteriales bacterium]|nr:GerAB/ArcD/ProY family transporter [Eubacteriales bacterium]